MGLIDKLIKEEKIFLKKEIKTYWNKYWVLRLNCTFIIAQINGAKEQTCPN